MKILTTFLITVITLITSITPSSAQTDDATVDTTYLLKQGAVFYSIKMFGYSNGTEQTSKMLVGDTATLVQSTVNRISAAAATMAVDARMVSKFRKQLNRLAQESDNVKSLTGADPLKQIQDLYVPPLLAPGWHIKNNGVTSTLTFTVNAQGNLRFSVAGGATKAAVLFGAVMKLVNYPSTGVDTDFYLMPGGNYTNLDGTLALRSPGN